MANTEPATPIPLPTLLPSILRLPRELRDLIYEQYVLVDGGYFYNSETGKLTQADGSPLQLSLASVCRQTRSEMEGLPFRVNTIAFSSTYSPANRQDVYMHHGIIFDTIVRKRFFIRQHVTKLLTQEIAQAILEVYPQYAPVVDGWKAGSWAATALVLNINVSCGEAPSIWNDFLHFVFTQLSNHPDFVSIFQEEEDRSTVVPSFQPFDGRGLALSNLTPEPWKILEENDFKRLGPISRTNLNWAPSYSPQTRYTHSAAATALRFLRTLPESSRQSLREIILKEECETVAFPECHGRGFIEICKQYPKLRVRRFASLWKSVFNVSSRSSFIDSSTSPQGGSLMANNKLASSDITKATGSWIAEALALPSLGMPEGSYMLILDGDPIPEQISRVFQVLQRDIAWQSALDVCYARNYLPTPSWLDRRLRVGYMYEGLPELIWRLPIDSTLIQCNFDIGPSQDVERMVEEHRGWSLSKWERSWKSQIPHQFQTEPPLPPWHLLRWLYVQYT